VEVVFHSMCTRHCLAVIASGAALLDIHPRCRPWTPLSGQAHRFRRNLALSTGDVYGRSIGEQQVTVRDNGLTARQGRSDDHFRLRSTGSLLLVLVTATSSSTT